MILGLAGFLRRWSGGTKEEEKEEEDQKTLAKMNLELGNQAVGTKQHDLRPWRQ